MFLPPTGESASGSSIDFVIMSSKEFLHEIIFYRQQIGRQNE